MSKYVSNLLCHFVGRSKANDDERYALLIEILRGGKLLTNIQDPENPVSHFQNGSQCEHVGEVFGKCDCVCFCDIPDESLKIHTDKYSRFGMGFEKNFIAAQGAHPVMYVPINYPIVERGDQSDKGRSNTPREANRYYPYLLSLSTYLPVLLEMGFSSSKLEQLVKQFGLESWINLFGTNVTNAIFSGKMHPLVFSMLQGTATQMAYVKLYDSTLPDHHPDNYYMEREWRSLLNIHFDLQNINRIYLPNADYKEKFEQEFPEYSGTFYLFE